MTPLAARCPSRTVVNAMRWTAWITVAALLLAAPSASAQIDPRDDAMSDAPEFSKRIHLDLDYQGAPGCAEPEFFQDIVRSIEYHWDPWRPISPWHVKIRVTSNGPWYNGEGEMRDAAGKLRWHNKFTRRWRCYIVLQHLAIGVATTIVVVEPIKDPEPCPAPKTEQVTLCPATRFDIWPEFPLAPLRAPEPDPPKPLDRWPFAIRFGAGAGPELIASDFGSVRVSGELGVRYRAVSVGVEVHGDPPLGSLSYPSVGVVSFARLSGAFLLCGHWALFVGCGVGDAGKLLFPNHVQALPASVFFGAAGVRAGLEFPVGAPRFFLRVAGDVLAPIHAASYSTARGNIFQVAGTSLGLGLSFVAELAP
jgi:hypothetical protein